MTMRERMQSDLRLTVPSILMAPYAAPKFRLIVCPLAAQINTELSTATREEKFTFERAVCSGISALSSHLHSTRTCALQSPARAYRERITGERQLEKCSKHVKIA